MSDQADDFLAGLQKDALLSALDDASQIQECLNSGLTGDANKKISDILKSLHNMKGNFHASGLKYIGDFVHLFEQALVDISEKHVVEISDLQVADSGVLEFLISDTVENFLFYREELAQGQVDSEELLNKRKPVIQLLSNWSPSTSGAQNTQIASQNNEFLVPEDDKIIEKNKDIENVFSKAAPESVATEARLVAAATEDIKDAYTEKRQPVREYLLFRLGDKSFVMLANRVIEILKPQQVVSVPGQASNVLGVFLHQNRTVPLLKICEECYESKSVIVVQRKDEIVAFSATAVEQVLSLDSRSFSVFRARSGSKSEKLISNIVLVDGRTTMVLNVEHLEAA